MSTLTSSSASKWLVQLLWIVYFALACGDSTSRRVQVEQSSGRNPCTEEFLRDYWHDDFVPGFHIVCFQRKTTTTTTASQEVVIRRQLSVQIYRFGLKDDLVTFDDLPWDWSVVKSTCFEQEADDTSDNEDEDMGGGLGLDADPENFQPYALFTPQGQRLVDGSDYSLYSNNDQNNDNDDDDDDDEPEYYLGLSNIILTVLCNTGVVLLYQGGQFQWPGVRVGFERHEVALWDNHEYDKRFNRQNKNDKNNNNNNALSNNYQHHSQNVTITTLSLDPLVVSIQGFLNDDECTYIQEKAEPRLKYSGVVLMDHDQGKPDSDFRTSQSTFLTSHKGDQLLRGLDERVARLARVPVNHQEHVQVLRYGLGERYMHHTDYFDPSLYQKDPDTLDLIKHGRRNRLATVFWYLSNVTAGGETAFPTTFSKWNYEEQTSPCDWTTDGLLVKPERGKVIIFYSLLMSGEPDPHSLHEACPVKEGVKWAANKWIWNEPMNYVVDSSDNE